VRVVRSATPNLLLRLLRSFAISLAIQVTTLAAYIALGRALAPHIGMASFAAAACIVMLAASLPISFGGWGLRELSAIVALQAIGLSSASALLIALLIGFLSLAVIAGMAILVMLGRSEAAPPRAAIPATRVPDYVAVLDWSLPLVAATAVFFQIYLPTASGPLSVNLADPVVMIAAVLFLLRYGRHRPDWQVPCTEGYVVAATMVIAVAFVRGMMSFGWTDWAFANKALGWLMLLCYAATGALIVRRAPREGFSLLLKTFAAAGAAVAAIEIALAASRLAGFSVPSGFVDVQISGFSQNPNAFAFVLWLVFAAAAALPARPALRIALMAAALLGVWFTGSRAGLLAAPFVLAGTLFMGAPFRPLLASVISAVAVLAGIAVLSQLSLGLGGGALAGSVFVVLNRDEAASTLQHLRTMQEGLALFLEHPLFGAGLGAYMFDQIRSTGVPLVIHSTPVWLLAETGLVGLAVFLAAAGRLFALALGRRGEPWALVLFLMLCVMAVMSTVHELMYQRAFWLLLGAVLAIPAARREPS
jgi:O-antigen ligase